MSYRELGRPRPPTRTLGYLGRTELVRETEIVPRPVEGGGDPPRLALKFDLSGLSRGQIVFLAAVVGVSAVLVPMALSYGAQTAHASQGLPDGHGNYGSHPGWFGDFDTGPQFQASTMITFWRSLADRWPPVVKPAESRRSPPVPPAEPQLPGSTPQDIGLGYDLKKPGSAGDGCGVPLPEPEVQAQLLGAVPVNIGPDRICAAVGDNTHQVAVTEQDGGASQRVITVEVSGEDPASGGVLVDKPGPREVLMTVAPFGVFGKDLVVATQGDSITREVLVPDQFLVGEKTGFGNQVVWIGQGRGDERASVHILARGTGEIVSLDNVIFARVGDPKVRVVPDLGSRLKVLFEETDDGDFVAVAWDGVGTRECGLTETRVVGLVDPRAKIAWLFGLMGETGHDASLVHLGRGVEEDGTAQRVIAWSRPAVGDPTQMIVEMLPYDTEQNIGVLWAHHIPSEIDRIVGEMDGRGHLHLGAVHHKVDPDQRQEVFIHILLPFEGPPIQTEVPLPEGFKPKEWAMGRDGDNVLFAAASADGSTYLYTIDVFGNITLSHRVEPVVPIMVEELDVRGPKDIVFSGGGDVLVASRVETVIGLPVVQKGVGSSSSPAGYPFLPSK